MLRNTTVRWGALAQFFHWTIVVLIITQFVLAFYAEDLHGMKKLAILARHKSIGITILMLAVLRLAWRLFNPGPALPTTLKPYERFLAHFTHIALYVLIFITPLVAKNKPLYDFTVNLHATLAWTLAAIAGLHLLAALKHHFVMKDTVLKRMLPFTKTPEQEPAE
jgi:cytochrome b561